MLDVSGFILCGIVIFFAGRKLSYYGDLLSDLTGMGKAWLGLILMATITSLPELMVGFSASAIVQSADLAVSDVIGSCAANLCILALMDAFVPQHKPIFGQASQSHILAAAMGIILIALAGVGLALPEDLVIIAGIGFISLAFIIIYFVSVWVIYRYDMRNKMEAVVVTSPVEKKEIFLKKTILHFTLYAVLIVAAALLLPYFTEGIVKLTGMDESFAGTLLLAVSTSLPEIAVSMAAVRIGAIDLSVGNLLGSNLFNIFTLSLNDLFYKGNLLKDASDINLISVLATIIMSAVAVIGLTYRLKKKRYWLAWDALLIFGIYLLNIFIIYELTS